MSNGIVIARYLHGSTEKINRLPKCKLKKNKNKNQKTVSIDCMHTYLFSAKINYKSKTADHRYSTAYISNSSEFQGLAH